MPSIKQCLSLINTIDREFAGTVAFKNDKLTLPDGSKVALGMDRELWVLVYQKFSGENITVYEFNTKTGSVLVDKKLGTEKDKKFVKDVIKNFFEHADMDDVVTICAGQAAV
jgi:hypothetical protein